MPVYLSDDWIVAGRFTTADEHILSIDGVDVARWEGGRRHEVELLPFPDAWLRPIRPGDGADETLAWAGKPQPVTA